MGKPTAEDDLQQQQHRRGPEDLEAGGGGSCCCCCAAAAAASNAFSFRCVFVLLLSACVFLSAVFWIPPFRSLGSGGSRHRDRPAAIQASFILPKSVSFLSMHKERLEYDIFEEIGAPDTRVSVLSLNALTLPNFTYVVFGILPDSKHVPNTINPVILSILKSSMAELVLQQSNLSLTPSIFGKPFSFEILKFPGGITIIPIQTAPIWQITQNLFNFTLNYSIIQIQKNLDELKDQLKYGLNLKDYENVYVQMTNLNGSTVQPPVIVEASVLSDVGGRSLLPPRLKQLAQTITGSPAKNLGLNHSVFGKVKEVVLSSYLNHSIVSEAPSPSPSPADTPKSAPQDSNIFPHPPAAAPSDHDNIPPCSHCTSPPLSKQLPHAPTFRDWSQAPASQPSPVASPPVARAPRHRSCFPPEASSPGNLQTPATEGYSSPLPSPSPHKPPGHRTKPLHAPSTPHHSSHETSMAPLVAANQGPVSPPTAASFASQLFANMWIFLLLLILSFLL